MFEQSVSMTSYLASHHATSQHQPPPLLFSPFILAPSLPSSQSDRVFVLFSGSVDATSGVSWCPDCVAADPVIAAALKQVEDDVVFVHCAVGQRGFWKDQSNVFRCDVALVNGRAGSG